MAEQTPLLNHSVQIKDSMKNLLKRVLKKNYETFQIITFYTKGVKYYLFVLIVLSILIGLMETFQIVLIYPILNASFNLDGGGIPFFEPLYTLVRNTLDMPDVISFCLLFILFVFSTFMLSLLYKYITLQFSKQVVLEKKRAIFDKLMNNDYRYFVDTQRGDILYSGISAPSSILSSLNSTAVFFSDIFVSLSIIFILSFISPVGVALLLLGGLLFILVTRLIGKRIAYRLGTLALQSSELENDILSNYVQGLRQIRSANGDPYWKKKYNDALDHFWEKYVKYDFLTGLPGITIPSLFFSVIAIVVIFLYYLNQDGFLVIIPLIGTFAFAAIKILPRLSGIGSFNMTIMNCWPALEKVYHFLNENKYNTITNGKKRFETLTSDIIFDNVGFSYYENQQLIKDVHLTIKKNKITALVGHSGSGKSTIVSLLLRYYDVSTGSILINGIDLREYDLKTVLKKVGYVSQDTFLFNATIRNNIAFGGDYSDIQIIEAAKKANIHAFIASLPQSYESIIGDQGLKLSGGEKQRVAIARALVRNPEILVLDEATSNLDNESEAIVQNAINQISENNTTFIIAHRLSTIRKADTIFVMSNGRIVESGSHDELMEKRGRYFDLYSCGD